MKKGRRGDAATPFNFIPLGLPEEVVDHVDDLAAPRVDEHGVVVITHPLRARRGEGQAILPRVVDPIAAAVIARPQTPPDLIRAVAPAERIIIKAEVEPRAVVAPV